MQQTMWATILALVIYMASSMGGGNSGTPNRNTTPPQTPTPPPASSPATGTPSNSTTPKYGVITHDHVALRTKPSTSSQVVATLAKGTGLQIMGSSGEWYNVAVSAGTTGWVAKWLVKASATPPLRAPGNYEVIGYYIESNANDRLSMRSLQQNSDVITAIMPFFYSIDSNGKVTGRHNQAPITYAKSKGIKSLASIHNIKDNASFSGTVTHNLMKSASNRRAAINNIEALLKRHGYDGVNIDFESVWPSDRPYLTQFFRELAWALRPKGYLVTAALPAKTSDSRTNKWSGAYDYAAIAPYLDYAVLMTYDEHYKNGPPGPVASIGWVRNVIKYATGVMPKEKVVLGLAGYGYEWGGKTGRAVTFSQIESRIKTHRPVPRWHDQFQVPYFTYRANGISYTVWYENNHSKAAKLRLVEEYGLRGVALWRLGIEDPAMWNRLRAVK